MQLSLRDDITLKAFGLIATRMPDGSRGYSLIVFITAEDFRPIPLPLGFTAARHRRHGRREPHVRSGRPAPGPEERHAGHAAVPARSGRQRAGVDPQSLERVPGAAGQLPAGHPRQDRLVDADADPDGPGADPGVRVAPRGCSRSAASAPCCRRPTTISSASTSRRWASSTSTTAPPRSMPCWWTRGSPTSFPITGSAALRAGFGGGPSFVLSVGGFNPHFAPPANCPALERVDDRAELRQQPAADLRGLLRDHLQHGAVRRPRGALRQRRRLQRRRRRRLRRAGAAHAAALHRRLPGAAAAEARLAQPVHGRPEGLARRSAAAARQRQGDVRDPLVRLQRAASTPRW